MSTRSLMDVNEDSEILSKLGILSTKQSPNKAHKQTSSSTPRKEKNDFVEVKVDDWKWEADTFAAQSDDEQSDENLVYDKHTLLDDRSSNRSLRRRSSGVTCRNILLASSFLSLRFFWFVLKCPITFMLMLVSMLNS
ncbi:unnamed protein product [Anisakis simplex]|uniref:Ovule protein n=1 Tax=Anisakis simplex TaxID=6269 RepID=A0A0M3J938_ANISI|nr:unnamed protein product [Anisakis simplex]